MADASYDVVVIGGGSAGYAAARTTAARGLKTVVIEGGSEVGGLCILRGCMPTKALLHAAEVLHQSQRASVWGIHTGNTRFDFAEVMKRKNQMIGGFADYRRQQLSDGRFDFIRSSARFVDPHTLQLGDGRCVTGKAFVVATGSTLPEPKLPALKAAGYLTSDEALTLTSLPASIIVLGGGAVAVEFAQFFARFGVRVSLIQRSDRLLRPFDEDASRVIEGVFRKEGIQVFLGTRLTGAGRSEQGKYIEFEQNGRTIRVEAEEIFNGLGRVPNTAELGLEVAGVRTEAGRIVTEDTQQTTAAHIYAAGDCAGPYEVVHLAVMQGEVAGANVIQSEAPRRMDYRLRTFVVFTDPQVAGVGLTEWEAKKQGIPVRTATYPFNDHGKSLIMEALDGFVKLIVDPNSGEILGGSCVGPSGGELIHEVVVAMANRMTAKAFAAVPHYHPTLAEIWTYPAEELAT